jgi:hypothetical protein
MLGVNFATRTFCFSHCPAIQGAESVIAVASEQLLGPGWAALTEGYEP